jgi:hypothetical protein
VRGNYAVATRLVSISNRSEIDTKLTERSSALSPGDSLRVSEDVGTMKTALDIMAVLSRQEQMRPEFDLATEGLSLVLRVPNPESSILVMCDR